MHSVNGGLIELEVAGMQHVTRRAAEKDADRSGDGVIHGEELGRDAAEIHFVAWLDLHELGVFNPMLFELALDKAQGHLRCIDGHLTIKVFDEVRQRTGMVFVAVRDHDAAQLVGVLQHIGVIGQDKIDAGMVIVREHQARIIEHHVALAFEHGHVLADGIQATERDDLQRGAAILFRGIEGALTGARALTGLVDVSLFRKLRALEIKLDMLDRLRAFAAVLRAHVTIAL